MKTEELITTLKALLTEAHKTPGFGAALVAAKIELVLTRRDRQEMLAMIKALSA